MQTSGTEHLKREKTAKTKKERRAIPRALALSDIVIFFCAMVLGRTHLAFGACPFGIAFLCALPHHVFIGLMGTVAGALSRGSSGVLFAMIAFVALFVRILISGAEKHSEGGVMFRESLTLRMSAGAIGGFVSAVYELLSRGIVTESVLFSLTMIFGVALATVAFGLVFSYPITLKGALFGSTTLFSSTGLREENNKRHLCLFSLLCYLLALSFGLSGIELLGVSLGGIFAFVVSLFVARRFGAVCGAVVGFLSGVVVAPEFAVACALTGAICGLLFPYGLFFGEVASVVVSALWGIYTGGAVGLLTLLPEGLIGTMLLHPLLVRVFPDAKEGEEKTPSSEGSGERLLEEGIRKFEQERERMEDGHALSDSLLRLSVLLHNEEGKGRFLGEEEYRTLLQGAMKTRCKTCRYFDGCERSRTAFYLSSGALLQRLISHHVVEIQDIGECQDVEGKMAFIEALRLSVGRAEEEAYRNARRMPVGDLVRTFGEMVREGAGRKKDLWTQNPTLSTSLREALYAVGFSEAEASVYGKSEYRVFLSVRDLDSTRVTSPEVRNAISEACGGVLLGTPSFVRKGEYVRMEIPTKKRFCLKCASAILPLSKEGVSGDVIETYESADGRFLGVLCDGTGSGATAHESASFAQEVLRAMFGSSAPIPVVLRLLDEIMRRRSPEDGTTLDLFALDLYQGEAEFYKLGAVTSFIKRGDSLFSIRSGSLPLGIAEGTFRGERICAKVEKGDMVVLFSDGISSEPEGTPWLLELLAHTEEKEPKALAQQILLHAKREVGQGDDMSVLVCRVDTVA